MIQLTIDTIWTRRNYNKDSVLCLRNCESLYTTPSSFRCVLLLFFVVFVCLGVFFGVFFCASLSFIISTLKCQWSEFIIIPMNFLLSLLYAAISCHYLPIVLIYLYLFFSQIVDIKFGIRRPVSVISDSLRVWVPRSILVMSDSVLKCLIIHHVNCCHR